MNQTADQDASRRQAPRKKILLVDDEERLTRQTKRTLDRAGPYEVRAVNRAQLAVVAAREFKPDLILLDVMMPDGDGGQVAADIRDDVRLRNTPIIFLTAAVRSSEIDAHTRRIGGEIFMAKPVIIETLIACIEEYTQP